MSIIAKRRSLAELRFRLAQEARNLGMWIFPPRLRASPHPLSGLPDPAPVAGALRGSGFAATIAELAQAIRGHRFPLLGITIDTGPEIHWRRDYLSGIETGTDYFRRIPYLDAGRAGDHKVVWELNRHQHLVVLAQDYLLHGRRDSLAEIVRQLESWFEQNPFHEGINWASSLEVGFRALSWTWVWHIAHQDLAPEFRKRFLHWIHLHGAHLANNLSWYFAPNTHLLGEAVALHALGALFRFPESKRWADTGARAVARQMGAQVRSDGSHFEQSTYYHLYALDMFLFHAILSKPTDTYHEKLRLMAEYLDALQGPARELPFLGDDDGGRWFHPYGVHSHYGRATLATCAVYLRSPAWPATAEDLSAQAMWWMGANRSAPQYAPRQPRSRIFPDAGLAILRSGDLQVIFDAGPFGSGAAGHSHSDTLNVIARDGGREILVDSGTYTYVGDPHWRSRFRGTASHNTVRIDGLDQAVEVNPFRWESVPESRLVSQSLSGETDRVVAQCSYRGFIHRREVIFGKSGALLITDTVEGPASEHEIEQFWHFAGAADGKMYAFHGGDARAESGWRSTAFGRKTEIPVIRVYLKTTLPCRLAAAFALREGSIGVVPAAAGFAFEWTPASGNTAHYVSNIK